LQDRYAGDIGDFGKFHLLRELFKNSDELIAQIWYKYPDESHNSDGLHINYFDKVKDVDTELEEKLSYISSSNRSIKALEEAKLLKNMKYFTAPVVNENQKDLEFRKRWLNDAVSFSNGKAIVAVDPDNGIANKCIKQESKDMNKDIELLFFSDFKDKSKAGKHIFMDEIDAFYNLQELKILIIYHHLSRCTTHNKQIQIIQSKFQARYYKVLAIKHKPYSPRVYFFVCKDEGTYLKLKESLGSFSLKFENHWEYFD